MGLVLSRESASEDMEGLLYSFRKAKKGKAAREDFKTMAAKKQERMQKDKEAGNEKRKVHDWPSELVFFLRTVELLQGMCAMTGHNVRVFCHGPVLLPFCVLYGFRGFGRESVDGVDDPHGPTGVG
jgi:hypothetical protein